MIDSTELYSLISVWVTLTLFTVTFVWENKSIYVRFLTSEPNDLVNFGMLPWRFDLLKLMASCKICFAWSVLKRTPHELVTCRLNKITTMLLIIGKKGIFGFPEGTLVLDIVANMIIRYWFHNDNHFFFKMSLLLTCMHSSKIRKMHAFFPLGSNFNSRLN